MSYTTSTMASSGVQTVSKKPTKPTNGNGLLSSSDIKLALARLTTTSSSSAASQADRILALDQISSWIRTNLNSGHSLSDTLPIFQALATALMDPEWEVRHGVVNLVEELAASEMAGPELEDNLAVVLPSLIPRLGDARITVRKAAIQCLHLLLQSSYVFPSVMNALIRYGVDADERNVRRNTCLAFPIFFTSNLADEDFTTLIRALLKQLASAPTSADDQLSTAILRGLSSIKHLVGPDLFEETLSSMDEYLRNIYARYTTSAAPSSSMVSRTGAIPTTFSLDSLATVGNPSPRLSQSSSMDLLDQLPMGPTSSRSVFPSNTGSAPADPTSRGRSNMVCGFIPLELRDFLSSRDSKVRFNAVEQIRNRFEELGGTKKRYLEILIPTLPEFLSLLASLLHDSNFHVVKNALEMLCGLVARIHGAHLKPYSQQLVTMLVESLGDNKKVVQVWVMRYAMTLMRYLNTPYVVNCMGPSLSHKSSRVRQECIDIIISALLQFPSGDFDLNALCDMTVPALIDKKVAVRQAGLECMAVLAHLLGAGKLGPLVQSVHSVDMSGGEVMEAIKQRLARHQLPKLTNQGLVEYAALSKPVPDANSTPSHTVLSAGPSRRLLGEMEGESEYHGERRRPSASKSRGLSKLPWEMDDQASTSTMSRSSSIVALDDHKKLSGDMGSSVTSLTSDLSSRMRKEDMRKLKDIGLLPNSHLTPGSKSVPASGKTSPSDRVGMPMDAGSISYRNPAVAGGRRKLAPLETSNRDDTGPYSSPPVPMKPTLARSAGKRRGSQASIPPDEDGSNGVTSREDSGHSVRHPPTTTARQDSGFSSSATNSAYSLTRLPVGDTHHQLSVASMDTFVGPGGDDSEDEDDMYRSLASIRNSASKKKAARVQMETSDYSGSETSSARDTRRNDSTTKYNPYKGATFKANPTYDGLVIGKGYSEDPLAPIPGLPHQRTTGHWISEYTGGDGSGDTGTSGKQAADHRRKPIKGTANLSPIGMASSSHFGPTESHSDWVYAAEQDSFNVVGKRVFESSGRWDETCLGGMRSGTKVEDSQNLVETLNYRKRLRQQALRRQEEKRLTEDSRKLQPLERGGGNWIDESETSTSDMGCINGSTNRVSRPPQPPKHPASVKRNSTVTKAPMPPGAGVGRMHRSRSDNSLQHQDVDNYLSPLPSSNSTADPLPLAPITGLHPENQISEAVADLAKSDWQAKVSGLTVLQRAALFHGPMLLGRSVDLHQLTLAVCQECKNLRSQVSRMAIQTLGHLYKGLKKACDVDLDLTVRVLLHKASETSAFIRDDVEQALCDMVQSVTPQKAITALLQAGATHKNSAIRRTCACHFANVCQLMGPGRILSGIKDITDRVIITAGQFSIDSNPETRYFGRKIFLGLLNHQDFDKLLVKHISSNNLRSVREIIEGLRAKGLGEFPQTQTSLRRSSSMTRGISATSNAPSLASTLGTTSGQSDTKQRSTSKEEKSEERPQQFDDQEDDDEEVEEDINDDEVMLRLGSSMTSGDWRERETALEDLTNLVEERSEVVIVRLSNILSKFTPRLTDSNSKICQLALHTLSSILPRIGPSLPPSSIPPLVSATASHLYSLNTDTTKLASRILDEFIDYAEPGILLAPYMNILHSTSTSNLGKTSSNITPSPTQCSRYRPDILHKLTPLVDGLCSRNQMRPLRQLVFPELGRLLAYLISSPVSTQGRQDSGTLSGATRSLVCTLYLHLGEDLHDEMRSCCQEEMTGAMLRLLDDFTVPITDR